MSKGQPSFPSGVPQRPAAPWVASSDGTFRMKGLRLGERKQVAEVGRSGPGLLPRLLQGAQATRGPRVPALVPQPPAEPCTPWLGASNVCPGREGREARGDLKAGGPGGSPGGESHPKGSEKSCGDIHKALCFFVFVIFLAQDFSVSFDCFSF